MYKLGPPFMSNMALIPRKPC